MLVLSNCIAVRFTISRQTERQSALHRHFPTKSMKRGESADLNVHTVGSVKSADSHAHIIYTYIIIACASYRNVFFYNE